jgi:hypothetical protein
VTISIKHDFFYVTERVMGPDVKLTKEMCPKTEKEKEEMTRC